MSNILCTIMLSLSLNQPPIKIEVTQETVTIFVICDEQDQCVVIENEDGSISYIYEEKAENVPTKRVSRLLNEKNKQD